MRDASRRGRIRNGSSPQATTGVTLLKRQNRWQAQIVVDRRVTYLGVYQTRELARDAFLRAREITNTADARSL